MATLVDWTTNENVFTVQNKNTILDSAVIHDTHIRGIGFYGFTGDTSNTSNFESFLTVYSVSRNKITPINNNTLRIPCINLYDDSVMFAAGIPITYYDPRRITFTGCRYTADYVDITDKKIRFVVKFMTIKDYMNYRYNKVGRKEGIVKRELVYKPYGEGGGVKATVYKPDSNEMAEYMSNDYYVISDIKFYEQNNSGKYVPSSVKYDCYCPIYWKYVTDSYRDVNATAFVPMLSTIAMKNFNAEGLEYNAWLCHISGVDTIKLVYGNYDCVPNPYHSGYNSKYDSTEYANTSYPGDNNEHTSLNPRLCGLCGTKKALTSLLNQVGWARTEDPGKINDDDINTPTFPGSPTNPTGGGGGTGDNISDEIPLPDVSYLPNNTAYNRYWLTGSKVSDLQTFLFSDTFLQDIKRLWSDPAEYVINLTYYPFDGYSHHPAACTAENVSIGGIASNISAYAMLSNYQNVFNGGSIAIEEYYGTYLDYSPYTTAEIYIPYIGYRQLNLSDIMGKTLSLKYVVDFDTRAVTAILLSDNTPLTMYSGAFGVDIAISGNNNNQVAQNILGMIGNVASVAGGIVSLVATSGASAPAAVPQITSAATSLANQVVNVEIAPRQFGTPSPTTALYAPQQAFIVLHRPITAEPANYKELCGYNAGYSDKVSAFTGYLKASSVKLTANQTATDSEKSEIISLLQGGIYV